MIQAMKVGVRQGWIENITRIKNIWLSWRPLARLEPSIPVHLTVRGECSSPLNHHTHIKFKAWLAYYYHYYYHYYIYIKIIINIILSLLLLLLLLLLLSQIHFVGMAFFMFITERSKYIPSRWPVGWSFMFITEHPKYILMGWSLFRSLTGWPKYIPTGWSFLGPERHVPNTSWRDGHFYVLNKNVENTSWWDGHF